MLKHIREAVKRAGVPDVEYARGGKHPYLVVCGKRVICCSSPKNIEHAVRNIATDIRRAANAQG